MDKKIIAPVIIVCIISLFAGFVFSRIQHEKELLLVQQEIDWLKTELEVFYPPLPEQIFKLNGRVVEKGDDFLVMASQIQISQFPLPEGSWFETREIKVNIVEETEVFKIEWVEDFPTQLPEEEIIDPFERIFLSFEEIKDGEEIIVTFKEDVKDKKEGTASQVEINY